MRQLLRQHCVTGHLCTILQAIKIGEWKLQTKTNVSTKLAERFWTSNFFLENAGEERAYKIRNVVISVQFISRHIRFKNRSFHYFSYKWRLIISAPVMSYGIIYFMILFFVNMWPVLLHGHIFIILKKNIVCFWIHFIRIRVFKYLIFIYFSVNLICGGWKYGDQWRMRVTRKASELCIRVWSIACAFPLFLCYRGIQSIAVLYVWTLHTYLEPHA
jgi:hypothetical protein